MPPLRDRKALQPNTTAHSNVDAATKVKATKNEREEEIQQPASNNGKKRKAVKQEIEPEIKPETASNERPSTPPPTAGLPSELADEPNYQRKPGRNGPVTKYDWSLHAPDFPYWKEGPNGPKGKKVRTIWGERQDQKANWAVRNESYKDHNRYMCIHRGPNGPPTYDRAGFQLDFKKVVDSFKSDVWGGPQARARKYIRDERIMRAIFYEEGEAPEKGSLNSHSKAAWEDRVSKDLNIPFHKIGPKEFRKWEKKGFKKAKKGEYLKFSDKEHARLTRLEIGSALRK